MVKVKVAARSDICVSYCGGRRYPHRRLAVEVSSSFINDMLITYIISSLYVANIYVCNLRCFRIYMCVGLLYCDTMAGTIVAGFNHVFCAVLWLTCCI